MVHATFHRSFGAVENAGGLFLRHVVVVTQDHNLALGFWKICKERRRIHGRFAARQVGCRDRLGRGVASWDATAMPIAAQIERDLKEPGREALCGVEADCLFGDAQPGLLIEIFDILAPGVPEDEV